MKMDKELLKKARQAKTAEELMALAKENGIDISAERAEALFETLNSPARLSDEELENVAGGGCYHNGKLKVSAWYKCGGWRCKDCGGDENTSTCQYVKMPPLGCCQCRYYIHEDGYWLCNK